MTVTHSLPAERYHAIRAVSAGMIATFDAECPFKAWRSSPWNPARVTENEPFDKGKFGPSIRWTWIVFDINSKEPVLFEDKPATVDALSGTDMGPRAKARAWANKHLAPTREVVEDEDPDALMKELIGKRVKLNFTIKEDENGNEQVVLGSLFAYTG